MTKDRILITGARGFIGRTAVSKLLERGLLLNLAVREPVRESWHFDDGRVRVVVTGDLADDGSASRLAPAFSEVRSVVHLAGLAHIATADRSNADSLFLRSNVKATKNLVEMALVHGVSSFIHLSSLAAVTPNTSNRTIDDNTAVPPSTGYGRSKLMAEAEVQRLAGAGAFAISLRPPLVVGANARGNWARLQKLASSGLPLPLGSLDLKRSFASVQTLTDAILTLCNEPPNPSLSGNYCVADPEPLSVTEVITQLREGMNMAPRLFNCPTKLFAMIGQLTGRQRQLSGLIGPLEVDSSRFYANFGFRPDTPLSEAIRRSGAEYVRQVRS
ncbi:MAG: NAD-dependent epimerase/dehydratase family protein [Xanthobacteraceae bacterium]